MNERFNKGFVVHGDYQVCVLQFGTCPYGQGVSIIIIFFFECVFYSKSKLKNVLMFIKKDTHLFGALTS